MTASAALLAGLSSANAFPLNAAPQYEAGRSVVKPNRLVVASREKSPAKAKASTDDVAAKAKGLLSVVISIDKQRLTLYSDGEPIAHSRVSTGVPGHPTPTGVFSIIQKDRWHRSNIYYNAPMYFMQRITWSGVAMHEGVVPNSPASHGCIRLPGAFARQMWGITKLGVRVIIAHGEVTPVAISNEHLFTIKREPAEPKGEAQAGSAETVGGAFNALGLAQLSAAKRDGQASNTVFDVSKPLTPALDAMAYALGTPRETTGPELKPAEPKPLKPGPISVFISRKEGKLFVRKGFDPIFDAPVTFDQPDRPLGTHVFTALALKDDNTMRWTVVTAAPSGARSGPEAALDRITIPPATRDQISELMSPGASLIISDKGLGGETGKGTDFIVLTR